MGASSEDDGGTSESLLSLYKTAGTFGDDAADFVPPPRRSVGATIHAVAGADDVTPSAKLDVLRALAGADFPGYDESPDAYEALAGVIGSAYTVAPDQLLSDVKAEAGGERFTATKTGQALPHHVGLGMADLCEIRDVTVDGKPATWIFSELETDADFASVADWVLPDNWPKRGKALFKGMRPIDGAPATDIGGLGLSSHWHNLYIEDVQLVRRLKTALHCDYFESAGLTAGVTYELSFSVDNQLNVDRGFLLVTDVGPVRHVKALKIVGFTDRAWTDVAKLVCPFWTDWVRSAVESGTTTEPFPTPRPRPDTDPAPGGGDDRSAVLDEWVDFYGETAKTYTRMFGDVTGRVIDGGYTLRDAVGDGARYWSQIAKDWATAWAYGYETMQQMADEGFDSIVGPPGSDSKARFVPPAPADVATAAAADQAQTAAVRAEAAPTTGVPTESTILPYPGIALDTSVTCSALESIEDNPHVIPASDITATVVPLTQSLNGIQITARTQGAPPGFYVGEIGFPDGRQRLVQLYVSRARDQ